MKALSLMPGTEKTSDDKHYCVFTYCIGMYSLGYITSSRMVGSHIISRFNKLRPCPSFLEWLYHFIIILTMCKVLISLHCCQHLLLSTLKIIATILVVKW